MFLRFFKGFLFEDQTRKYDPKAKHMKNIPYMVRPFPFPQITAYKTTGISLTGYKQ